VAFVRSPARPFLCLAALTINPPAHAGTANVDLATRGTPAGFDELTRERESLVDIYLGGRKIGEALVTTKPGSLQFKSARDVLDKIPDLIPSPELIDRLGAELPTNSDVVCRAGNAGSCGAISPEFIGIIYDADRFRVDVFVNPKFLKLMNDKREGFLPLPSAPLSLTSSVGLALSGSVGGSSRYNLQDRTVIGLRNARLRVNASMASGLGLVIDDLVGEIDHKSLRYSAGLFWAPGNEFTGQRRILGAGVGTQFDTLANQEAVHGTPLIIFLPQPSRIELLIDGRLVSSRSYPAGNVDIDSTGLPEGSYPVVLRIHPTNGSVREERRFFVKNMQAPPVGHPIFYAYAGVLANTQRHQPISPSDTLYYQAGGAWRFTNKFGLDAGALGTQHKAIAHAGAWLIFDWARFRAAGLVSSAGDKGALLQASSGGNGPLRFSFDLRRIWSSDGQPLIPLPSLIDSFGATPPTGVQLATGSYTQATGSIALRLGSAYLAVVGSFRKDRNFRADYTVGPSINWPVITRRQVQLVLEASAQRTRTTIAGFAGFRMLFTSGGFSVLSRVGSSVQDERGDSKSPVTEAVGTLTAQYSRETAQGTLLNLQAGVDRNIESATVNAGATINSRFGNVRADIFHGVTGTAGTQYDLAFESGVALSPHGSMLGARDAQPSAIMVAVDGDAVNASFNVLVDDAVRGRVKTGQRLSLFMPGYKTYKVRLVPTAPLPVSYDSATREVTLYPGNVQSLAWRAESYFTIFAQAMLPDGAPVTGALVETPHGVAQTDDKGYFQIDVAHGDPIKVARSDGEACQVRLPQLALKDDFASVGKVVCR
jgi:Mat/Ecp fimbriae outer membrane usher protein